MSCERCKADPQPDNFGSPRQCAFDDDGKFTPKNWRCATIDYLLELSADCGDNVWGDDESLQYVPARSSNLEGGIGGWLILTRYKSRGCTSSLVHVGDFWPPEFGTLAMVEGAIDGIQSENKWRADHP